MVHHALCKEWLQALLWEQKEQERRKETKQKCTGHADSRGSMA